VVAKADKKGKPRGANGSSNRDAKKNSGDIAMAVETLNPEAGEIEKIRNILFGRQMADYDKRFAQLEARITSQIDALEGKIADHLKKIEASMEKQDDVLTKRLKSEQSERSQGVEALSQELVDAKDEISNTIDTLALKQAQEIEAVNTELATLSSELSDEIHIQQVEASKSLDQAVQALDEDKLARKALSQLLLDMAGRLSESPE
jgi:uncharacterized protein YukE